MCFCTLLNAEDSPSKISIDSHFGKGFGVLFWTKGWIEKIDLQKKTKGPPENPELLVIRNAEFSKEFIPVRFIDPQLLEKIKDVKAGTYTVLGFEDLDVGGTPSLSKGVDYPLPQDESWSIRRVFVVYQINLKP